MTDRPSTASTPSPPEADVAFQRAYPIGNSGTERSAFMRGWQARGLSFIREQERADSPSPEGAEPPIDRVAVGLDCVDCGHRPHGADSRPGIDVRCGEIIDASWSAGGPEPVHCECLDYGEVYRAHQRLLHEARREAALPEPSLDVERLADFERRLMGVLEQGHDLEKPGIRTALWIISEVWPEWAARRTEGPPTSRNDDIDIIEAALDDADLAAEYARLRGTEGSPDICPVEGCDELPEDHRHIGPIEELLEKARLVSQWHGAMNSGPLEVLDAELGELGEVVARVKANG